MNNTLKQKNLDDLQKGIKQLLERSRCPFSAEEKLLLIQCDEELQRLKVIEMKTGNVNLEDLSKITIIVFKVLDFLKDLF